MSEVAEIASMQMRMPGPDTALVREIFALSPSEVVKQAIETSPLVDRYQWKLAFLVYRVEEEGMYKPHKSMREFSCKCLSKSSSTISRYKEAADFCLSTQAPDEREQIMRTAPQTLAKSGIHRLAKKDRAEAVRLCGLGYEPARAHAGSTCATGR